MNNPEILKWGRIVLIVLAIFLGVTTLGALKGLRNPNPSYNSVSVSGEGEVVAVPDVATFYFTVSADGKTASVAQEAVTKKMDAILAELKNQGIEEKDIKTTDYSVFPKYRYEIGTPLPTVMMYPAPERQVQVPDGYTASHSITVKVRDTEKSGTLLTLVGEKGATYVSGLSFDIDDREALVEQARAEAIKDAKEKAKMLSKELGVRLVRVVSFYDNSGGGPMPYYSEAGMGGDMMTRSSVQAANIPTGENKIKIVVTINYEIR